jgi:5-oxoprolinase (ATP-hydrolysing)
MTNTRITDPEVLETRHPVRLMEFSLRSGTGGEGKWQGGEGVRRHYRFLKALEIALLTERRERSPYGLHGGGDGGKGKNTRILPDGRTLDLGGRAGYSALAGEELVVETPGGGGYGLRKEG